MKKIIFLKNLGLLFSARENVLNHFKSKVFQIKFSDKIATHEPRLGLATEPTKLVRSK